MAPQTIMLVRSPHPNWTQLQTMLRKQRCMHVIADVDRPDEAVQMVMAEEIDIIFIGSTLPGLIELVRGLRAASPASRIIVVGKLLESAEHVRLADLGAPNFLLWKDLTEATLRPIVEAVLGGLCVVSQAAMERQMLPDRRRGPRASDLALTGDERAVLTSLGAGLAPGEIADELSVSESTVKRILATLRAKFGVCSTNALCLQAGRLGF